MENKQEVKKETISIMAGSAVVGFIVVALCVAGLLLIKPADDTVQGQIDGTSVRVSGKLPGRLAELYVEEGDMVKAGDTLAHIHSSLIDAKLMQAQSMEDAASAQNQKAQSGTRIERLYAREDGRNDYNRNGKERDHLLLHEANRPELHGEVP